MSEQHPENTEQNEVAESHGGFGEMLRGTREKMGLSTQAVAQDLHLSERLVVDLEEENWEALPAHTYVTGYLRNYAKLLDLPVDSLLEKMPKAPEEEFKVDPATMPRKQASSGDPKVKVISVLIAGVLLGLSALWVMNNNKEESSPAQTTAVNETRQPAVTEMTPMQQAELSASESESVSESEMAHDQEPVGQATPQDQQGPSAAEQSATEQSDAAPAEEITVEETNEPEIEPLTPKTPQSSLELRINQDSWAEISDADGRELLHTLLRTGTTEVIYGVAPFKVFLGYAQGVAIYYNGELFDHSAFKRNDDVASFRVGESADNRPR